MQQGFKSSSEAQVLPIKVIPQAERKMGNQLPMCVKMEFSCLSLLTTKSYIRHVQASL